jgi:hypothetical protein
MCRHFEHRIAGSFVYFMKSRPHFVVFRSIEVALVQNDGGRDIIDFTCHKEPVQKREFDLRKVQSHHKKGPVQIGRDDV